MEKKRLITIIGLLLIIGITGISFAYLQTKKDGNEQNLGLANFDLIILTDMKPITIENSYPMSDYEGLKNKSNSFQIKNAGEVIANYQVSLIDKDIISTLENKDIRYKLTRIKNEEEEVEVEGSTNGETEVVTKEVREELEIENLDANGVIDEGLIEAGEIIGYELVIWIDYNANPKANSIFTKVVSLEGNSANSLDASGANYPELTESMIPVYYDKASDTEGVWKKADSRNIDRDNRWFNYSEQEWANSVTIKESEETIQKTDGDIDPKARYCDGVNDYMNLGHANHNFGKTASIIARFKANSFQSNQYMFVADGVRLITGGDSLGRNRIMFQIQIGSKYPSVIFPYIKVGTWYTVVGTYNGQELKIYINGKLYTSTPQTGNIDRIDSQMTLCRHMAVTDQWYANTTVSDAILYNDVLTDYEISKYFSGEILDYPRDNLLIEKNRTNLTPSTNPTIEENGDLTFNGTNQSLVTGFRSQDFQDKISLMGRFKINKFNTANQYVIGNPENAGSAIYINSSKKVVYQIYINNAWINLEASEELGLDKWYTVVGTYDGSRMKLYINGKLVNQQEQEGLIKVSAAPFTLGADSNSSGSSYSLYTAMTMSDAMIYTDALTESEVKYAFSGEIDDYPKDNILTRFNGVKTLSKKEYYQEADVGTGIPEEEIAGMYVWIPRYKYLKFSNDNEMINIKFEHGIETTGDGANSYTHKSFTSEGKELTGFWVSKFELSTDDESCVNNQSIGNCNKNGLKLYSLPDKISLRYIDSNNMNSNISSMGEENVHMIKDKEYEAVMYLGKSRYGKEGNNLYKGEYKEIYKNNYYENIEGIETYKTGYSGGSSEAELGVEGYVYNDLTLEDEKGYLGGGASTTGNIYGVYDLNGGSKEMTVSDNNKYYVRTFKEISAETAKVEAVSDTGSRAVITHFREFGWIK